MVEVIAVDRTVTNAFVAIWCSFKSNLLGFHDSSRLCDSLLRSVGHLPNVKVSWQSALWPKNQDYILKILLPDEIIYKISLDVEVCGNLETRFLNWKLMVQWVFNTSKCRDDYNT